MSALPPTPPLTARQVPELRQDVVDWFGSPGSLTTLARLLSGRNDGIQQVQSTADMLRRRKTSVEAAELYYVSSDMTDLAVQIAGGLTEWFTTDEAPVDDHGFVVWGRYLQDGAGDFAGMMPVAAAWSRTGASFSVDTYGYAPTLERDAQRSGLMAKGFKPLFEDMRAGKLTWLGTMDVTGGEDVSGMRGVLLATWLLIRQPAEHRQAVHEVEEVPASRAAQKRIARGGGDPTRPVRYVTLRQTLRREPGDPDSGDHIQRVYQHRWFVRPHPTQQYYPSTGEHKKIWRGPYLVVPAGCEGAPILGGERVNVLRR